MSLTGPNAFVTVGDPDWWSLTNRGTDAYVDGRMRGVLQTSTSNHLVVSAGARAISKGPWYFEFEVKVTAGNNRVGVVSDLARDFSSTTLSAVSGAGGLAGDVGYRFNVAGAGVINCTGTGTDQTGLASLAAGDRLGVRVRSVAGVPKVQFYKNGVAQGVEATPNAGTSFYIAFFGQAATSEGFLHVDRDDLKYLPDGAQAWGSAARVADGGGYSRGLAFLDSAVLGASANYTLDSYLRTATAAAATNGSVAATRGRAPSTKILYFEAVLEVVGSWRVGVMKQGTTLAVTTPVGNSADSWGYAGNAGDRYNNSIATATGVSTTTARDRIGVFVTATSIWFSKNGVIIGGGSPLLNTSASYTNLTGTMVPVLSVINTSGNCRLRLCTHAREQLYRPYYAEAWDGSDLMPEVHFKDRLGNDPYIESAVHFGAVWGGGSRGGGVGAVEIQNHDGIYDKLIDASLRDQAIAIDRLYEGETLPEAEGRAVADSVEFQGTSLFRILSRPRLSKLETRVQFPTFVVGVVLYAPMRKVEGASLTYELGQTQFGYVTQVLDKGIAVFDYTRTRQAIKDTLAIQRGVTPAGKQVATVSAQRVLLPCAITNGDFSSWTADNPNGWTVTETGPNSIVTQSGNAARFLRTAGAAAVRITQVYNVVNAGTDIIFARFTISAWTQGTAQTGDSGATTAAINLVATGVYHESFGFTGSVNLLIEALNGGGNFDWTIDLAEFFETRSMATFSQAIPYLLCDLGGFSESFVVVGTPDTVAGDDTVGYFSQERPTIATAAEEILAGHLCDLIEDGAGTIFVDRMEPPDQILTSSLNWLGTIVEADIKFNGEIQVNDDTAPALSNKLTHANNFDVHSETDLAGGVSDALRTALTLPAAETTCATSFDPFYAHGNNNAPIQRYCSSASPDYTGERVGEVYAFRRRFYTFVLDVAKVRRWRPGGYATLTHSRYGLSAGKNVKVISITRKAKSPTATVKVWG